MRSNTLIRKTWMAIALLAGLGGLGGTERIGIPILGTALAAAPPPMAGANLSPRILRALAEQGAGELIPIIVTTERPAGESDLNVARSAGAVVRRRYSELNGYAADVPAGTIRNLARARGVSRVSYDQEVRSLNDLNFVTIGADVAGRAYGLDGSGVTVAVLDSGIAPHPDLGGRLLTEVEVVGGEPGFADYYGHGTHVAGIIAGDGSSSSEGSSFRKLNGVAPGARLVSVRVLGADGSGAVSDVLAGIDWVISNKDLYEIRVLNISLGHPIDESYLTDPLCQAVERAWSAGIVVVVSAGNGGQLGYGTVGSPGDDPFVITVGASDNAGTASRADDLLSSFSSRGPTYLDHFVKPDLLAPGAGTISLRATGSTLDTAHPELRVKVGEFRDDPASAEQDSEYFRMSGTSMATPVVSGMVAIMIQADRSITPDTVKMRLMKSAEKRPEYDIFSEGAGLADLPSAMSIREAASVPALSPTASWTETGILIQDTGEIWSDTVVWTDAAIWGSDPLRGTGALWADSIVWGGTRNTNVTAESTASGDSIVWGGTHAGH